MSEVEIISKFCIEKHIYDVYKNELEVYITLLL